MGQEDVLGIFWRTHRWESRNAFTELKGKLCCILIFGYGRAGRGLSGVGGQWSIVQLSVKRVLSRQGTTQEDVFAAACMPVAFHLLHCEFRSVAF